MSYDDEQIPKCHSKEEINKFFTKHAECELNSQRYPDGIELIFCKTHAEYESMSRQKKEGTYVFLRPDDNTIELDEDEHQIPQTSIDLYEGDKVDTWFVNGLLHVRVGITTLQLDREIAEQLLIALNNSSDKMNELGLKIGEYVDSSA